MQPEEQELKGLQILAVDDEESNLLLLRRILERAGYTNVETTTDPFHVPEMFVKTRPRLARRTGPRPGGGM
jgi:PleD family two-component response regulator